MEEKVDDESILSVVVGYDGLRRGDIPVAERNRYAGLRVELTEAIDFNEEKPYVLKLSVPEELDSVQAKAILPNILEVRVWDKDSKFSRSFIVDLRALENEQPGLYGKLINGEEISISIETLSGGLVKNIKEIEVLFSERIDSDQMAFVNIKFGRMPLPITTGRPIDRTPVYSGQLQEGQFVLKGFLDRYSDVSEVWNSKINAGLALLRTFRRGGIPDVSVEVVESLDRQMDFMIGEKEEFLKLTVIS
ncbi:MAG: hypothetical protein P9M03_07835 [Candidatus Theseobacter exili]|nr:hypothetical protein [Candidatus Theseobacter exili]